MSLTGKRFLLLVVIVLLVLTGLGTAAMGRASETVAPGTTGLVSAPSLLDVSSQGAASVRAAQKAPLPQAQVDILTLQVNEAWRSADWNRCIEILTVVVTVDPANAEMCERLYQARVNYGWLLLSRTKLADAHKQFTLALQVRPAGHEALEGLRLVQQLNVPVAAVCPPSQPVPCTPAPLPTVCVPAVAVACTPAPAPGTLRIYVVRRGDNLFRLALRFNTSVSLIMKANGLQSTTIKVGQKLVIP